MIKKIFLLLIFSPLVVRATLEAPFPGLTGRPDLPEYISFLFNFVMGVGGAIAFAALVFGGFRYMTSAGNPETMSDAKSRIKGAILGLCLLLASFIILDQINPQIKEIEFPATDWGIAGLFFTGELDGVDIKDAATDINRTANLPVYYKNLEYDCSNLEAENSPAYLVNIFHRENFRLRQEGTPANTTKLECGDSIDINLLGKSFNIVRQDPGVYVYFGGCTDAAYRKRITRREPVLSSVFAGKARCVEVVNNPEEGIFFGAFVHESRSFRGRCHNDIIFTKGDDVRQSTIAYSSVSVFSWDEEKEGDVFVHFYSKPFTDVANAGSFEITEIREDYMTINASAINYTGLPPDQRPDPGKTVNINDVRGSIQISGSDLDRRDGDFLVVLFGDGHCQPFWHTVQNLKTEWIGATKAFNRNRYDLDKIYIVPIK